MGRQLPQQWPLAPNPCLSSLAGMLQSSLGAQLSHLDPLAWKYGAKISNPKNPQNKCDVGCAYPIFINMYVDIRGTNFISVQNSFSIPSSDLDAMEMYI